MASFNGCGRVAALLAGVAFAAFAMQAQAETRSYAVSWFGLASNAHDGDCAGGGVWADLFAFV